MEATVESSTVPASKCLHDPVLVTALKCAVKFGEFGHLTFFKDNKVVFSIRMYL